MDEIDLLMKRISPISEVVDQFKKENTINQRGFTKINEGEIMGPVNIKYNAVTCECAECAALIIITPVYAVDKYQADWECEECGKVVCEDCHDGWQTLNYGDSEGEADEKGVCEKCYIAAVKRHEKRAQYKDD